VTSGFPSFFEIFSFSSTGLSALLIIGFLELILAHKSLILFLSVGFDSTFFFASPSESEPKELYT